MWKRTRCQLRKKSSQCPLRKRKLEEKSDDDEDEVLTPVCPTPVSATTAIEAVSMFSAFLETCENVPETVHDCVAQLKDFASQSYAKRCRQSKITDFFVVRRCLKNADAYFTSEILHK